MFESCVNYVRARTGQVVNVAIRTRHWNEHAMRMQAIAHQGVALGGVDGTDPSILAFLLGRITGTKVATQGLRSYHVLLQLRAPMLVGQDVIAVVIKKREPLQGRVMSLRQAAMPTQLSTARQGRTSCFYSPVSDAGVLYDTTQFRTRNITDTSTKNVKVWNLLDRKAGRSEMT